MTIDLPARTELFCDSCGRSGAGESWDIPTCPECIEAKQVAWRKVHWRSLIDEHGAAVLRAPAGYADKSFGSWQGDIPPGVQEWLGAPNSIFMVYGPVGCGKTHLATATGLKWLSEDAPDPLGAKPLWIDAQHMVEMLKPNDEQEATLDAVLKACLLVLDDIGVERATDFGMDRVRLVVRHRHMEELPTIITSNIGPKKIRETDERLGSRLGSGVRVRLEGRDWRS